MKCGEGKKEKVRGRMSSNPTLFHLSIEAGPMAHADDDGYHASPILGPVEVVADWKGHGVLLMMPCW